MVKCTLDDGENMKLEEIQKVKVPYYVTMTDRFMSGWGPAKNKTNKLVLCARTYEEALVIETNAKDRPEMRHVNIRSTKPYYNPEYYLVSLHGPEDYQTWYRKDRPFREGEHEDTDQ